MFGKLKGRATLGLEAFVGGFESTLFMITRIRETCSGWIRLNNVLSVFVCVCEHYSTLEIRRINADTLEWHGCYSWEDFVCHYNSSAEEKMSSNEF